jgi:PAS domain S-box-containing protein
MPDGQQQYETDVARDWEGLSRFFDSSDALLAVLDSNGCFLRANRRWEAVLGYSEATLRGRSAADLVHPEDRRHWAASPEPDTGAEPVHLRWYTREGGVRWLSWSCLPGGDQGVVLCVGHDVTSRVERWGGEPGVREVPLALVGNRDDPARQIACTVCDFTRFFQLSDDLMAILDEDGRFVSANATWQRLLGRRSSGLLGQKFLDVVDPPDRPAARQYWLDVLTHRRAGELSSRVRTTWGTARPIRWRAVRDPHLGVVHLVGRDRDELLQARDEEEQIRAIIESVPYPIFALDRDFTIAHVNAASLETFGYMPAELLGASIDMIVPGFSGVVGPSLGGTETSSLRFERGGLRKGGVGIPVRALVTVPGRGSGRGPTALVKDLSQERLDRAKSLDEARAFEASAIHVRLANDLHDGLLQSLTGASLQLEVIQRMLQRDPRLAGERLAALQGSLVEEQRELRFFVDEFKSGGEGWGTHDAPIKSRLERMLVRVEQIWEVRSNLVATVEVEPSVARAHEILRIVHEAAVNSIRHGRATEVSVSLECGAEGTVIQVADNGSGFPFHGQFDHEKLVEGRMGPRRLKHRIMGIGGRIEIESSSEGGTVTARLPGEQGIA